MTFNLQRFIDAQAPIYDTALAELSAGKKRTHWMWFVFPQHRALGRSATALRYGLVSIDEARAYLAHPVLGPRLRECTDAMLAARSDLSAHDILGSPDDLKFQSCMTTFALVVPEEHRFKDALERFFEGRRDEQSVRLLSRGSA
jgi:uncharacterized protein (DUF1810 family)